METPNTRSRRKRDLENSSQEDGLRIAWVHDSQIRKAVLLATEDDVITPPTPTQCPRPISSLLKSSSSSSNSISNTASGSSKSIHSSNRPPRKRPCRSHRSLPLPPSSRNGYDESSLEPSSLPSMSILESGNTNVEKEKEKTRLDYLLDRFSLLSSPMDDEKSNKRKDYIGGKYNDENGIGIGSGSGNGIETPSRNLRSRNNGNKSNKPMMFTSTPLKKKSTDLNIPPQPNDNSTSLTSDPKEIFKSTTMPPNVTFIKTGLSPTRSPIKGGPPRIGLGSQHHHNNNNKPSIITSNRSGGWTRTNSGKAFRTPFLESKNTTTNVVPNLGIRSSPRKHNSSIQNQSHHVRDRDNTHDGPVRGPSVPTTSMNNNSHKTANRPNSNSNVRVSPIKRPKTIRSNTTVSSTSTSRSSSSSVRSSLPPTPPTSKNQNLEIEFKNFDVGENDPEDTSFDSFDGIFADGGEEIEMLLRRVDGSN